MASGHMMRVGPFVFSLSTAAYDKLQRSDNWRWVAIERLGNELANQHMGPGERTITLTGVVYSLLDLASQPGNPGAPIGLKQINALRGVGDMAAPVVVTDGMGNTFGRWVILSISESQSSFFDHGGARKQEFDVTMRFYGQGGAGGGAFGFGGVGSMLSAVALFSSAAGLASRQIGQDISVSAALTADMAGVGVTLGVSNA